ncbi:MAG: NAD-dependent DNA ligase LigA [Planctomycetia bacterium]|nr:NAD-dependent DNA ligase LigA [Planctomycetia bacterium]
MPKTTPADRAAELRKEIDHHNQLYYVEAAPVISDREFDKLLQELIDLEKKHPELVTPDSPTQRVGGAPIPGFKQLTHKVPMLSIENSYDEDDLRKFDADVRKALGPKAVVEYVTELKIDGVSMAITYENGQLAFAATRGSGSVGDDVTHNAKTIAAIPLKLATKNPPKTFEVRGEVYMTRSELVRINAEQAKKKADPYKNTRNLTAGTLKLLDPKECAKRKLSIFVYGAGVMEGLKLHKQSELLAKLKEFGFPVNPHEKLCKSIDEVLAYCKHWDKKRKELPYDTDGIVIKVNDWDQREKIGYTAKVPKWAKAFKFEAEQGTTKLGAVVFHIGKFGELTPVATFDPPVQLAGTTVTHASMHNASWVAERDVRIGDTVVVEKKGEIIPQVVDVIKSDRKGTEKVITWPEFCPECGAPVKKEETANSYNFNCSNPEACSGGMWKRLEGYARKTRMEIDGLGREVAKQLVESGLVKSVPDLYRVDKKQLLTLEKFGDTKAQKLLDGIAASKNRGLARLLPALAIYMVGEEMAEALAEEFPDIDLIIAAKPEQLAKVKGWGPERAKYLRAYFDGPNGKKLVAELKELGIKMTHDKKAAPAGGGSLVGKTIVVTGTLAGYDRVGIERAIKDNGGKTSGSVSKKTDFLLLGELPKASSKLEDAKKLGIKIINEDEFNKMIGK